MHLAQGDTVDSAHVLIGEHIGATAAYVAMTRGRDANTAHLVAEDLADARKQWVDVFSRDRADLGPAHFSGFPAWLLWIFVHIFFLIGFRNRVIVLIEWGISYFTFSRGARLITGEAPSPPP